MMLVPARTSYLSLTGLEDDVIPVRAEIYAAGRELQSRTEALGLEISDWLINTHSPSTDAAMSGFLTAWNGYVADLDDWDPSNENWYIDRWGRRNEVIAFRKRFTDLQSWFQALGGSGSTPQYKPGELPSASPWVDIARYGVYALAAGVAIYGLAQVSPFVRSLTSSLRLHRS